MARQGAITSEDQTFVETWENIGTYTNVIIRLDARGDERPETITGDRQFYITTEERLITQSRILDKANDPFQNGSFRPILVPDSVDTESNPNALSDEEIKKIFSASDLAYSEWLRTIDSPATLDRMMRLAEDADDLTMKRFNLLRERYTDMHPKKRLTTNDEELARFLGQRGARDSQAGGRSSEYRPS